MTLGNTLINQYKKNITKKKKNNERRRKKKQKKCERKKEIKKTEYSNRENRDKRR